MSTYQGPTAEILGFSLHRDDPLGTIDVPWNVGMTVLYGANGAGKSTILRALASAVDGVKTILWSDHQIHVRIRDLDLPWPAQSDDDSGPDPLARSILQIVEEGLAEIPLRDLTDLRAETIDEPFLNELRDFRIELERWRRHDPSPFPASTALQLMWRNRKVPSEVISELTRLPLFTLTALGRPDEPRWLVSTSMIEDELAPLMTNEARLFKAIAAVLDGFGRFKGELGASIDPALERAQAELAWMYIYENTDIAVHYHLDDIRGMYGPEKYGSELSLASTYAELTWVAIEVGDTAHRLPSWAPVRNFELGAGKVDGLPRQLGTDTRDLQQQTADFVIANFQNIDEFQIAAFEPVLDSIDSLRTHITRIPRIGLRPGSTSDWIDGRPIEWTAIDEPTGRVISIDELSTAQGRWARFAISYALNESSRRSGPQLMILDEPELALHQKAARDVAKQLEAFSSENDLAVYVATHSSPFLSLPEASLFHVWRDLLDGGNVAVTELDKSALGKLAEKLDLEGSEVLQLVRVFLIVEGEHDLAVLKEAIGPDLAMVGAEMMAIRGSDNIMTIPDSEVVLKYTDAHVVVALDSVRQASIEQAWKEAVELAEGGDRDRAKGVISEVQWRLNEITKEEDQILSLAKRLIDSGQTSRFHLFGFSKPDIIQYLPVDAFGLSKSWEELAAEFQKRPHRRTRFKDWLRGPPRNGKVNTESVTRAAAIADFEPYFDEFASLVRICAEAAQS